MTMWVTAFPAFSNRSNNPYNALLYDHMLPLVEGVREFQMRQFMTRRSDILHIHWPDLIVGDPQPLKAALRSGLLLLRLAEARARGAKVIWTVHNLSPHDHRHHALQARFWPTFHRMLDGAIYMSDISRREAYKVYPTLKHIPNTIIPHGHYRPILRNSCSRDEARVRLGLPRQKTVFLCFGHIRRYKNIPLLIREFRALARDDFHLVVVGGPSSDDALKREIQHLAQDRPDITLVLEFVSDDVLANYLAACDYVVTPFDRILNSGSVLMALSAGRPVISPRMGSLADVEQSVGPGWVRAYQGPFEGRLLEEAAATPPPPVGPNLDSYDWDVLAHKTVAFYKRVVAGER